MSNKIKLIGVRELKTEEQIEENKDYGIVLIASLISTEVPCSFEEGEEKDNIIYKLKVSQVDAIYDLKEKKPIELQQGKSQSQKYRFRIEQKLSKDEYDFYMSWLLSKVDEHTEEYLEDIKKL